MSLGGTYSTGTVTVVNGSKAVIGSGVLWNDVEEGDWLYVNGVVGVIDAVASNYTSLTLKTNWAGQGAVGASYLIVKMSWLRYDPAITQAQLRKFINAIDSAGLFLYVSGSAPDDANGEDGQYALKTNTVPWKLWVKISGSWQLQGSPSGLNARGAWSGTTAYLIGDWVTRLGASYGAIQGNTNQPPESSPTYWQLIAQSGGRYDISAWATDRPASGEKLLKFIIPTTVLFPSGLAQAYAGAETAATANAVFSLRKNDVEFATASFAGTYPNLLAYSHNLANSVWARGSIDPTATAMGSNGVDTLNKLVPDLSNVRHTVAQSVKVTARAYTLSAEILAGELSWVGLSFGQGANVDGAYFNASTGSAGTAASGTTAAITSLGSGRYRASITRTLSAGTALAQIGAYSANGQTAAAGNNSNGIYAGYVQFEAASSASTYVSTVLPGSIGTFAAASDTTFAAGDVFSVITPDPRDATLAGITLTVPGFR